MTIDIELLSNGLRVLASGGANATSDWVRPSDWLAMPSDAANKISILTAVFDTGNNFAALTIVVSSGTYSVDWGDGSSSTGIASGATTYHQYVYSDADLNGTLSTRGYKQALVVITTSGGNITSIQLGTKHNQSGLTTGSNAWLDVQINAPSCTSLSLSGNCWSGMVGRVTVTALGAITDATNMFYNCSSLASLSFPSGFGGAITSATNMFYNCRSLASLSFPSGFGGAITNATNMFAECSSLASLSFPSGFGGAVTDATGMFYNCFSLASLSFPSGFGGAITSATSMFYNCSSLASLSFPSGFGGAITNATNMFVNCASLASLSFPSGFGGAITNATNMFVNCFSLARATNLGVPITFSLASCGLSASALDEVYTALPTVVGKTITVTGNWGTASDTPSIATGKGWTVTG